MNVALINDASPGSRTQITRTGILRAIHYTSDAYYIILKYILNKYKQKNYKKDRKDEI